MKCLGRLVVTANGWSDGEEGDAEWHRVSFGDENLFWNQTAITAEQHCEL